MTDTAKLIPTREACKKLGVTPSGVSRMVKRGALVPAQVVAAARHGVFLFDPADVEALAEARKAGAR